MNIVETSKKDISKKITLLNFILSVIILIYHSKCDKAMSYESEDFILQLSTIITFFGHCAVPTFFMLSAFLFYRNFSIDNFHDKLKKRFKTLCIPYLFWNLFYCILFTSFHYIPIIRNSTNTTTEFNLTENLYGILMSQYTPLWFVRNLIVYVVFSPVIFYLIKNRITGIVVIITTILINLFGIEFSYKSVFYWFPIYIVGAYLGKHYSEIIMTKSFRSKQILVICFITFTLSFLILYFTNSSYSYFIYRLVSPIGLWILLDYLINYGKIKMKDTYTYSFFIYVNHFFILTALQRIITNMLGSNNIVYGINYLIVPILVLFILITLGKLFKRNFSKFYYMSTGGR